MLLDGRGEDSAGFFQVYRCTDFASTFLSSPSQAKVQGRPQPCPCKSVTGPRLRVATHFQRRQVHPLSPSHPTASVEVWFASFATFVAFESFFQGSTTGAFEAFIVQTAKFLVSTFEQKRWAIHEASWGQLRPVWAEEFSKQLDLDRPQSKTMAFTTRHWNCCSGLRQGLGWSNRFTRLAEKPSASTTSSRLCTV